MKKEITKEEFENAVNNHKPCAWIRFAFKHFGIDKNSNNFNWRKIGNLVGMSLIILFIVGFITTIANAPIWVIKYSTYTYFLILGVTVFSLLGAFIMNDLRLLKIMKELNITPNEYKKMLDKFNS